MFDRPCPSVLRHLALAGLALCIAPLTRAEGLSYEDALYLAGQSPAVAARQAALASANSARRAAGQLPDPRLVAGIDNLPVTGADRYALTRDQMTMRRIGIEQDMPTAARRDAQRERAEALEWRERVAVARERLRVQHEAAMAWLTRSARGVSVLTCCPPRRARSRRGAGSPR